MVSNTLFKPPMAQHYNGKPGVPPASFDLRCDQVPGQRRKPWLSRANGMTSGQSIVKFGREEMRNCDVRVEYGKPMTTATGGSDPYCASNCIPSQEVLGDPANKIYSRQARPCQYYANDGCLAKYTEHDHHDNIKWVPCDCSPNWFTDIAAITAFDKSLGSTGTEFGNFIDGLVGSNAANGTGFTTPVLTMADKELQNRTSAEAVAAMYVTARQSGVGVLTSQGAPEFLTADVLAFNQTGAIKGFEKQTNEARLYLLSYNLQITAPWGNPALFNVPVSNFAPFQPYVFDPASTPTAPIAAKATDVYQGTCLQNVLSEWNTLMLNDTTNAVRIANEFFAFGSANASSATKKMLANFTGIGSTVAGCPVGLYSSTTTAQNCALAGWPEQQATTAGSYLAAVMVHSQYVLNSQQNPTLYPMTAPPQPTIQLGGFNAPSDPQPSSFAFAQDVMPYLTDVPMTNVGAYNIKGGNAPPVPCFPACPTDETCEKGVCVKKKKSSEWEDIIIGAGLLGIAGSFIYLYYGGR